VLLGINFYNKIL